MNSEIANFAFKHSPYIPYDPTRQPLFASYVGHNAVGGVQPFVYSNWRNEELSWHDSCYIHAGLNPFPEMRIKGPQAKEFMSRNLTNGFDNFAVGRIKHAIMVTPAGKLNADGLVLHTADDEYETTCLNPYLQYRHSIQDYDCTIEDMTGDTFFYQLGGPRSLEIVEKATGEDLRDIKFLRFRQSSIAGRSVRVQRIGMAGSLAYEVHGDFADAIPVYEALIEAGKEYGLVKLGLQAYWNTHTENGFPQSSIHFPYASETDSEYYKMLVESKSTLLLLTASHTKLTGSLGDDPSLRFVNPIELGWERAVDFSHDFIGRDALQKIAAGPHRQPVTLVWNADDVVDVWRSGLEPGEAYGWMDGPVDYDEAGGYEYRADKVLAGGQMVGTSTGRMHSWYYRQMISMGLVEPDYAQEGTQVTVLWGNPGERQKEIRATVARWPYMNENRNEDIDVSGIGR